MRLENDIDPKQLFEQNLIEKFLTFKSSLKFASNIYNSKITLDKKN